MRCYFTPPPPLSIASHSKLISIIVWATLSHLAPAHIISLGRGVKQVDGVKSANWSIVEGEVRVGKWERQRVGDAPGLLPGGGINHASQRFFPAGPWRSSPQRVEQLAPPLGGQRRGSTQLFGDRMRAIISNGNKDYLAFAHYFSAEN